MWCWRCGKYCLAGKCCLASRTSPSAPGRGCYGQTTTPPPGGYRPPEGSMLQLNNPPGTFGSWRLPAPAACPPKSNGFGISDGTYHYRHYRTSLTLHPTSYTSTKAPPGHHMYPKNKRPQRTNKHTQINHSAADRTKKNKSRCAFRSNGVTIYLSSYT